MSLIQNDLREELLREGCDLPKKGVIFEKRGVMIEKKKGVIFEKKGVPVVVGEKDQNDK